MEKIKDNVNNEQKAEGEKMELSFAVESGQAEMGASTDLGKFRDVNALLKAYSSLQAEFTRRSQRLKELENRMDNLNTAQGEMHGLEVEKLRESAKQRRLNGKAFDEFVYDLEKNAKGEEVDNATVSSNFAPVQTQAVENSEYKKEEKDLEEEMPKNNDAKGIMGAIQGKDIGDSANASSRKETKLSPDDLYKQVCLDEQVRLKVIGEYLNSLTKTGVPLMQGGDSVVISSPIKPKSIGEAGNMALRLFKGN